MKLQVSMPGKVFLLGEYAALYGNSSIVAATAPRFAAQFSSSLGAVANADTLYSLQSPIGRFAEKLNELSLLQQFRFFDPYDGAGGFGGSTAEFGLFLYLQNLLRSSQKEKKSLAVEAVWTQYRSLFLQERRPPSGVDLVAQWQGGVNLISFQEQTLQVRAIESHTLLASCVILSAAHRPGRKVRTHEHLHQLEFSERDSRSLGAQVDRAVDFLNSKNLHSFSQACSQYADALNELGLEHLEAYRERRELMKIPGVAGAKGLGALLADGFLVIVQPEVLQNVDQRECFLHQVRALDLQVVAIGIHSEQGISEVIDSE